MREFTLIFLIDLVNNLLPFLILDIFSNHLLKHKYADKYHNKRLFYLIPIEIILGIAVQNVILFTLLLLLSYYLYVIVLYNVTFRNSIIYVVKFFLFYYVSLAALYFTLSYIIDFIPNSTSLLSNHFYIYLKGILLNAIIYIFSSFYLNRRRLKGQTINNPYKRSIYFIVALIIFVLGCFIIFIYTLDASKETMENIVMVIFLINTLMIILILSIYEKIIDFLQDAARRQIQQQKYEITQSYYDELSEKSKQLSSLRHDFKNHLGVISGRLEQKNYSDALNYLNHITSQIQSAGDLVITNSTTVSAILQSKKSECERKGIIFSYTTAFEKIYKLSDIQITIILGNILDNAIEALDIEEMSDKYIIITISQVDTYLAIQCENPYFNKPQEQNGYLITTKAEKEFHGIGLKNVSEICDTYRGELQYSFDNSIFTIRILLPNY
jgi:two-component system, LytTR family, sensor histidine kinase AgrC